MPSKRRNTMKTIIQFFQLKSKEIKFRLTLYRFLEQFADEIANNKEELQRKIIHDFTEMIHSGVRQEPDE